MSQMNLCTNMVYYFLLYQIGNYSIYCNQKIKEDISQVHAVIMKFSVAVVEIPLY